MARRLSDGRGRLRRRRGRLTAASPSLLKAVDSWAASWKSVRDNSNLSQRSLLYCWPGEDKAERVYQSLRRQQHLRRRGTLEEPKLPRQRRGQDGAGTRRECIC